MNPILPTAKAYFPALTGLRAVAAYLVYAHHAFALHPFSKKPFHLLYQEGHIGVAIFFVLSGFLIALRYGEIFQKEGKRAWWPYLVHRFARIYPVYLVCTLVALVFRQDFRPDVWLINLFIGQGLFLDLSMSGVGVGWSMTVEVMFYAAAPLVLRYWKQLGLVKWVFLTLAAGCLLLVIGQFPLPYHFFPDWIFMVRASFFGRCFEFYLGIWLANRYVLTKPKPVTGSKWEGLLTYGGFLGLVGSMFLLAYVRGFPPAVSFSLTQILTFNSINNYLLPIFIGAIILGLVREKTLLSKVLGSRIAEELGKGSYLFYLVHFTFGFDVLYFHVWQDRGGVLLLLALLSVAGYYILEAPAHKWVLRKALKPLEHSSK
jgi:peptidoglycan/LPS O-acetylase OafA/YrhL